LLFRRSAIRGPSSHVEPTLLLLYSIHLHTFNWNPILFTFVSFLVALACVLSLGWLCLTLWSWVGSVFEKPSDQYLDLICDESLTCWGLNLNSGYFDNFTFILVSCGESCLLVSWCTGGRCNMTGSDEDRSRSRKSGAENWEWSSKGWMLGDRTIGWHRVRFVPYTWKWGARVSWLCLKTKVGFSSLGLKTGSFGLVIWASKSPR
jgi:hypothetical protein